MDGLMDGLICGFVMFMEIMWLGLNHLLKHFYISYWFSVLGSRFSVLIRFKFTKTMSA
jgi:hypothetical protein